MRSVKLLRLALLCVLLSLSWLLAVQLPGSSPAQLGLLGIANAQEPPGTKPATITIDGRVFQTVVFEEELASDGRPTRAGSLIVKFRAPSGQAERNDAHVKAGALLVEPLLAADTVRVQVGPNQGPAALAGYRSHRSVERAEPDYVVRASFTPTDTRFGEQWGMVQILAGRPAALPGTSAWDISTSSSTTRIAILDCGVYSSSSQRVSPDGLPGHPDVRNKVVDERNFTTSPNGTDDMCNHGTHVAGIAAASTNNGTGVAGVGFNASIVNVKVLGDTGSGSFAGIINGILWAAGCDVNPCGPRRAEVINMSLGAPGPCSLDVQGAIDLAQAQGLVIVAAAGNANASGAETPGNCNGVIAVAASDQSDTRAAFSNFGPGVDVAAPGVGILSTDRTGGYALFSGTSMASPHVAGLAALLWTTIHNTGNQAVVDRIFCSANKNALAGSAQGRIDAFAAVSSAPGCLPALSINDVSVSEGNAGPSNAVFSVALSAVSGQPVTVNFATASGTAAAPSDYTATSGTLTFGPGETTKQVIVPVIGDTLFEPNETFFVNLSGAVNASIADPQGQGTIVNDDPAPAPALSINDVSQNEGNAGLSSFNFTVTLAPASTQRVEVNFATANGTAIAGSDYQATTGRLRFDPGQTARTISISVNGDTASESNETFFVNLSSPTGGATIADGQGQGTIVNDDAPPVPSLAINDVSVTEGNAGSVNAVFTVSLAAGSAQTVTVDFATANGTAVAPGDYGATSGTLTFAPGETTKTIAVPVVGDTASEPNETFFVNLSNPLGGVTIGDGQGQGTIVNDDAPPAPALAIGDANRLEGNAGTADLVFAVTLTPASTQRVEATFATANGTAVAGSDYEARTGSVRFDPGQTTSTITIRVFGDTVVEPNETFFVNLSSPTGGATVADGQGQGTIVNDD